MNTISVLASISRKAGGLQQSVRRLHQTLNELSGVNVFVAALLDEYSVEDCPEWLPLPVSLSRVIGPKAFGWAPGLFPQLLQDEADIIHSHGIWQYPSLAVNRWHDRTNKPYLISPHGMLDPWAVRNSAWKKRIALAFYERKHLENSACIRALCEAEANAIRQFGLRNPICIIPNAIDMPIDHHANHKVQKVPWSGTLTNGQKVLLYLGRIHPKKGLLNLIRAWASVRQSEWVLAIAGWDQGGHEADLKDLCKLLGVAFANGKPENGGQQTPASIFFLGPQFGNEKASCYANCDAFILPSLSEGLPMVILEAWAYGKPVVMTLECNLPEGFAANAAIQIEPNAASITEGLNSLFKSSDSSVHVMGTNGRSLVNTHFNWPKCASDMLQVYHWLLGSGAKPGVVI